MNLGRIETTGVSSIRARITNPFIGGGLANPSRRLVPEGGGGRYHRLNAIEWHPPEILAVPPGTASKGKKNARREQNPQGFVRIVIAAFRYAIGGERFLITKTRNGVIFSHIQKSLLVGSFPGTND